MKDEDKRGLTQKSTRQLPLAPDSVTPEWFADQWNRFRKHPRGGIVLKTREHFTGSDVFYFHSPEGRRIFRIIRNLNEIDRIAAEKGYPSRNDLFRDKRADTLRGDIHVDMGMQALQFRFVSPGQDGWKIEWYDVMSQVFVSVLGWVFDWARSGELSKLRECAHCKKWFVAARKLMSQRFCSVICRTASERKNPKGKERRRDYMRNYMRERREAS